MAPLRLGVIGTGMIAGGHARAALAIPDLAQVVALCDPSPAALGRCAPRFGITRTYEKAHAPLDAPDFDAVVLCTPHDTYASLAVARAGKHVLVEKPMACTPKECRTMVAEADAEGVTLMVGQCQRYHPYFRGLKRLIAGGGIVISVAVHKLDLLRYLIGEVARVCATCRTTTPAFVHGAEDLVIATLEFACGTVGGMFAPWSAFRLRYSRNLMLFGDDGAVHSLSEDPAQVGPALVASRRRSPVAEGGFAGQFGGFSPVEPGRTGLPSTEPFVNQLAHFVPCCRTGEEPPSSGRDSLGTMALIFGIYAAARSGKVVYPQ
jgi:predicted dehydrogenase